MTIHELLKLRSAVAAKEDGIQVAVLLTGLVAAKVERLHELYPEQSRSRIVGDMLDCVFMALDAELARRLSKPR